MQISQIIPTNPKLSPNLTIGLWVEQASYPEAGAGQIQFYVPSQNAYFIEHWQKSVVDGLSLDGLLYKAFNLRLAEHLYMGHQESTLFYIHHTEVRKMRFVPTDDFPEIEALEKASKTRSRQDFIPVKNYLRFYHRQMGSFPLTWSDQQAIMHQWRTTGQLMGLIPYLMRCEKEACPVSVTQHLAALRQCQEEPFRQKNENLQIVSAK